MIGAVRRLFSISSCQKLKARREHTDELGNAGSRLHVVEARSGVRDRLHGEGLDARLGGINRFTSVADAVDGLSGYRAPGVSRRARGHLRDVRLGSLADIKEPEQQLPGLAKALVRSRASEVADEAHPRNEPIT
jgi:hypothetical protein